MIMETLLFEVVKDGRIDKFEQEILHRLRGPLNIPKERFNKLAARVRSEVSPDPELGSFDNRAFFSKILSKLRNVATIEECKFILKRISLLLDYDLEQHLKSIRFSPDFTNNLHHNDISVRSMAIQDLITSDLPDKNGLLQKLLQTEKDVQLLYELRKGLNELEYLEKSTDSSGKEQFSPGENTEISNRDLFSDKRETVRNAFSHAVRHKLTKWLPDMMKAGQKHDDPFLRICLLRLMALCGDKYFPQIIAGLSDPEPRVIAGTIELLEAKGNSSVMARIAVFASHENNRVRANALKALHNLGDNKALSLFGKMLGSKYTAYRDSAVYAICTLQIPEALPLLEKALNDPSENVRIKALNGIEALVAKGDKQAAAVLVKNTSLKMPVSPADKSSDQLADSGPQALHSDQPSLRIKAIRKLVEEDDKNAWQYISQRLQIEKDTRVISTAVKYLPQLFKDEEKAAELLREFLHESDDDRVKANAIEALSEIITEYERNMFLPWLEHRSNRIVGNAIIALSKSEDYEMLYRREISSALLRLAASTDKIHNLTAIYCLNKLQNDSFLEALEKLLRSKNPQINSRAVECLERISLKSEYARELKVKHDKRRKWSMSS
jgi:HEAT repeat protein